MKNKELTGYASIDNPHEIGESFISRHPIIPNTSIYAALNLLSKSYIKEPCVEMYDTVINYDKLLKDSVKLSLSLKELGVKKGQIVSISMPNLYQGIISFLACNRIGAISTFLNPNAGLEEIKQYLNLFESEVFINYKKTNEENKLYKEGTNIKYIVTVNNENNINLDTSHYIDRGESIDFNQLGSLSKFQRNYPMIGKNNQDALILFTSGSTGKPKSVVLTNKNVLATGIYLKNSSHISGIGDKRNLVCVPFSYPYGFATSTILTLMSGKIAILAPDIGSNTISNYLDKSPNIIFGSPALLELIMRNTKNNQDLSSIKTFISGGDFLTPQNILKAQDFFRKHNANVEICNGSGNAETVGSGTNPVGQEIRIETVGKPLVGCKCMIIDPEELEKYGNIKEKKYLEEGTLCISGDNVFKEYYKDIKTTKNSKFIYKGREYFLTGTRGFLDKDGYFTLTGRASRFYIMESLDKVYLDRVQNIINLNEYVENCAVVKVPDEENLYVNKVYIVLKKGIENTEEILDKIINSIKEPVSDKINNEVFQLKSFEIPTYYEIVDSIPRRNYSDKIDYKLLEEDAISKLSNKKDISTSKVLKKQV